MPIDTAQKQNQNNTALSASGVCPQRTHATSPKDHPPPPLSLFLYRNERTPLASRVRRFPSTPSKLSGEMRGNRFTLPPLQRSYPPPPRRHHHTPSTALAEPGWNLVSATSACCVRRATQETPSRPGGVGKDLHVVRYRRRKLFMYARHTTTLACLSFLQTCFRIKNPSSPPPPPAM